MSLSNRGHFSDAPKLTRVSLLDALPPSQVGLPWHQLTEFIHGCSQSQQGRRKRLWTMDQCLFILEACPRLVSCTFAGIAFDNHPVDFTESTRAHLRHSHLRTLRLQSNPDPSILFQHLALPALQSCQLSPNHEHGSTIRLTALAELISRTSCVIEELSFGIKTPLLEFLAFLEFVPELRKLMVTLDIDALIYATTCRETR